MEDAVEKKKKRNWKRSRRKWIQQEWKELPTACQVLGR
jgi:hypothetical protein